MLRTGAAVATIVALIGGPLGFAAYTFDKGISEAATRCEVKLLGDVAEYTGADLCSIH